MHDSHVALFSCCRKLLSQNPDDRPSAEKLLKMKIFRRQTEGAAPSPEVGV